MVACNLLCVFCFSLSNITWQLFAFLAFVPDISQSEEGPSKHQVRGDY